MDFGDEKCLQKKTAVWGWRKSHRISASPGSEHPSHFAAPAFTCFHAITIDWSISAQQALQQQATTKAESLILQHLSIAEEEFWCLWSKKLNWGLSFPKCPVPSTQDEWAVMIRKGPCLLETSCTLLLNRYSFGKDLRVGSLWCNFIAYHLWMCTYWKWGVFSLCWGIQKWEQQREAMSWYIMVMFYTTR